MEACPEMNHPGWIKELPPNTIFVFGSNIEGRHGAGAAKTAHDKFGAEYGVGEGRTGQCYAIPTKGYGLKVLELISIKEHVDKFLTYASKHPELTFLVTEIGCGLSKYSTRQIAPMFIYRSRNVILPERFEEILEYNNHI